MKKLISIALVLFVIVGAVNANINRIDAEEDVAQIGNDKYQSLSEAISSSKMTMS